MCDKHQQIVKQSRHKLEMPLFFLAAFLTISTFLGALGIAFFHDEVLDIVRSELVTEFKNEHPEYTHLTEKEVTEKLPDEDKEMLAAIDEFSIPTVLLAPITLFLIMFFSIGAMYGELRTDGIKVTKEQFPEVYEMWEEMANKLGLKTVPELYIQNGNGALNAFATCIPGYRSFGAIYSDILERALANDDMDSLRFILGHELGHIRLRHVAWWYNMLTFMANMPIISFFIGLPLSRAREYGCDKVGFKLSGDRECKGLIMLASGKHLYQQVNLSAYEKEQIIKTSIWDMAANAKIDHPVITWRVAAIRQNRHGDLIWHSKFEANKISNQDKE